MVADSESVVTSEVSMMPYVNIDQICGRCERPVRSMRTYTGRSVIFDAEALPVGLDPDHEGWVPGLWKMDGRRWLALAPLALYGHAKKSRVTHVVLPHRCPVYLAAVAERSAVG